jgi:hypothetical protein
MEPDHRTELASRIETFRWFSARLGTGAPHPQLGDARSHIIGFRVAVSENKTLSRKGGCGECGS